MRRYDLVVIGGGTAGLVSALIGAGAGARVALVEADRTGGDCLWTGCVPSKSLIAAAAAAQGIREAGQLGVDAGEPEVDFERVMAHVHGARNRIAPHDSPERLRADGVDVFQARARFLAPGTIDAGGTELVHRTAIVATGSRPGPPRIKGLSEADPLTSDNLWDLRRLPARLVVLGGGPIGCELGQAFARLGSSVTVIEMDDRLLPREEPRAGALIAERLRVEGVNLHLGAEATAVRFGNGGEAVIEIDSPEGLRTIAFDRILVATGRRPSSFGLGLDSVGVETDDSGAVAVDDRLRTTAPRIYAAGDVTGAMPFTHVAAHHARIASVNALFGLRRRVDYGAVPRVVFTDPEIAAVGLAEAEARDRWGERTQVLDYDHADLDRAITSGRTAGFAKLIGDRRGRLVGATIAGTAAGETIAELSARVAAGDGIGSISSAVHAYPTFTEAAARAADEHQRRRYSTPRARALMRPVLALLRRLDRPDRQTSRH